QWEYAARGGNQSTGCKFSGSNAVGDVAWYSGNSGSLTSHRVGTKKANELGLYDMSGNVYEWCLDGYTNDNSRAEPEFVRGSDQVDSKRVRRGGSWRNIARDCRSANRHGDPPDYRRSNLGLRLALVFDDGQKTVQAGDKTFPELITLPDETRIEMVKIKAGSFMMGSPENELGRVHDEKRHRVTLTRDFWLGTFEVTQGQWKSVMGNNPSFLKSGNNYPVENVSWHDAKKFCDTLNERYSDKLPQGYHFDLPTEAQWEYACRAGTITALNSGKNLTGNNYYCENLNESGWYKYKRKRLSTHEVGQKRPNAWGVYDMHGNVWEWCRDWYGDYDGDATDPTGPASGTKRIFRGGSWHDASGSCRSANRGNLAPTFRSNNLGFRLALVPVQ
ncbi:MAG: formylglycine-generating enzyme family protein, partial [Lentisphaeria bacterium]|nr:formylglycine-generating enzyme family protein [Lentisphaeria bacterium]